MDSKLLLINCLTLLYLEYQVEEKAHSAELCKDVISSIKLPDMPLEVQTGREVQQGLKTTALWLIEEINNKTLDKVQLLQRIRISTKDDSYLYNAFTDGLVDIGSKELTKKQINGLRKTLKEYLNRQIINTLLTKAFQKISFTSNTDHKELVRELYTKLEPYTHDVYAYNNPAIVDSVDFDNEEELEDLFNRSSIELSNEGVLKTGIQAFNRMLGSSKGFRRGEMVLLGALQHNFKTGMMLTLLRMLSIYNKPYMRDETKKPLFTFFSLENELTTNVMWLYANIYENETGQACDISNVNIKEASKYIKEKLRVNGYEIKMYRINPNNFTFMDFFDVINNLESDGYEIHAVFCDYLNMMSKKGIQAGPNGFEVRALFRIIRNFVAPKGITFITPHQLSSDAKSLVRQGVDNFVQEIANKGYYDSCRLIDQEVDLEILMHIEMLNRKSFLTMQRGKHRGVKVTPVEDRYFVLPFHDIGTIKDDLDKPDSSMKSLGSKSLGEGGTEWFNE